MSERTVHFLLHVPKCAGTTVEAHFRTHLGTGFLLAPRWESLLRNIVGNRYPRLDPEALSKVRVVSGHSLSVGLGHLFPGAAIRESVLLRDPTGYLLSFYNYRWSRFEEGWGARPPRFETWLHAQRRNPITRFLLNRYFEQGVPALYRLSSADRLAFLEERLQRFHFVGSYRLADLMIAGISCELGISRTVSSQNVSAARRLTAADLPLELRRGIEAENALDQHLWERWGDRGWSQQPMPPPPRLPSADQPRYLAGDIGSGILKKIMR